MRLVLSPRARALLRRFPRTNAYSALELVLLALLALQAARLVWAVVTPVTPLGDWRPSAPGGVGQPTELLRSFDPFFRLGGGDKPAAVTTLQLTLFGTRINEATGGGSAIIATPDEVQKSYKVGDEIMPGATLKAVAFDHVSIDRGGTVEDLYLDQSKPVTPVAPLPEGMVQTTAAPRVTLQDINSRGLSFADLKAGIGFIPRIDGGKITGLVLRPNGDGSAFAKAGLKQGDIATEILGKPISGPGDIDKAAATLKDGGILSLMVERGASTIPIGINVTGQ
ncbi:type II secretory protein PulC [Sphingomonas koreensis]|nr:type II secretory protein PulC [Sphingomonas koreensis]